ncbi:MAG: EAL domain-containing protein (putative c-di-GMP-specific phosphodiesterase class I) [Paraglaciecola sp.]|jgi:hypothetical protein
MIYELGSWIVETVFQKLIDWSSVSDVTVKMAINIYQPSKLKINGSCMT